MKEQSPAASDALMAENLNKAPAAYVQSTSNLNASGELASNVTNGSSSSIRPADDSTTATNEHGGNNNNEEEEDEWGGDGRSCGCIPRTVKGRLLGTEDGWSIDFYMNPVSMALSILIIWSFVIWCATDDNAGTEIAEWQKWIVKYWTWFYIAGLIAMGGFITFILFSRFGSIKLGPKDEPPRFSLGSWFAMLFSAGVGVGMYFWGVAEPIAHYVDSKNGNNRYYTDGDNLERALDALNVTWFHWGLTASSVYCVVGLPLAYFTHVKNAPLKFSSAFVPLLGKKYANGFIGDMIDTFAVVGTMFGVATSLGLGVIQLNAFLNFMAPNEFDADDTDLRIIIIWIVTAFATISVFTGLDAGIRRLSEGNFVFCLLLVFYVFFICDPFYITNLFISCVGYHMQHLIELTFFTDAFQQAGFTDGNDSYESFMSWWTVFYWGWWIAWSPFVGIFIAQISRGRTIREFILGNMFVPTLFTSLWLTVFGGVGLYHELAFDGMVYDANYYSASYDDYSYSNGYDRTNIPPIHYAGNNTNYSFVFCSDTVTQIPINASDGTAWSELNATMAYETITTKSYYSEYRGNKVVYLECFPSETMLFEMIDSYPLGSFMNVLAGIGIVTYFVTSSDSASHVIDVLTANGNEEPPKIQRIFWALSEGAVASVLLSIGGPEALSALQTVSIASGLPFCAVLLVLCYAFYYALRVDAGEIDPNARVNWSSFFWDSTNPKETYLAVPPRNEFAMYSARALFCPCVANWLNYEAAAQKDVENEIFSKAQGSRIFWSLLLILPAVLVFIFCILGIWFDGWAYVGLVLYVFYFSVNAWHRGRIRALYGVDGNFFCDWCAHFLCCAMWAIVQEQEQIKAGDVDLIAARQHVPDQSNANMNVELTTQGNNKGRSGVSSSGVGDDTLAVGDNQQFQD